MSKHDPKKKQEITSAEQVPNSAGNAKLIVEADLYNEALQILEANTDRLDLYIKAKGLLEQILDYKDSQKLLEKCTDKISSITIANNEKKRKRNVVITIVSVIVGIIAIGLLAMSRSATIDSEKQAELEKAYRYIEQAKKEQDANKKNNRYNSAYEILSTLGDYKNAKYEIVLSKVERIKEMSDAGEYADALTLYRSMSSTVLEGSDENIDGAFRYINDSITTRAMAAYNSANYYEALTYFRTLPVDSEEITTYIQNCQTNAIKASGVGDMVLFGTYQISVDNKSFGYDEDISWIVVAKEGNKYLLVSESALLNEVYNTDIKNVGWETSSLRALLNGQNFIDRAFNDNEKARILTTQNGECEDKVFILSKEEAEKYLTNGKMKTSGTPYAYFRGLEGFAEEKSCSYWLRDTSDCYALYVNESGVVADQGYIANHISVGVRPAIWIAVD